jgi:hypothetical protein
MAMSRWALFAVMVLASVSPGCSCSKTPTAGSGDGGSPGDGAIVDDGGRLAMLVITPDPATVDVTAGGAPAQQVFTATATVGGHASDVSAQSVWSIDDAALGAMSGATFTSGTTRGGATIVRAVYTTGGGATLEAQAQLIVRFHASSVVNCPGCSAFPGDATPACTGTAAAPTLVYPPDGVLLPPNMNVIEVHFLPGQGNDVFEIDFQNTALDVRVETSCTAVTSSRGYATGGCAYALNQTDWTNLATTARGGEAVKVTVRGAPASGACVTQSDSRSISFAEEDINGGIYYWQSVVQGGVAGKTGGIFRHDFGTTNTAGEPFMTPGTANKCVGCHVLSRDGERMFFGSDDADADDEYGDMHGVLMEVATKTSVSAQLAPGFGTFAPDHKRLLVTDGTGTKNPPVFHRYDGDTGALVNDVAVGSSGTRITHPDWSKDGATVYFVVPGSMLTWGNHKDDTHFAAGSIYKTTYDAVSDSFSAPVALVTSSGPDENNYYPAISPDGQYLVFNRAVGTDVAGHDAFSNPNARLLALTMSGGTPIDMTLANGGTGTGLSNSWPRWSPFIQAYQGKPLLWVTFSSTRDYGLRVQNENVPAAQGGPLVSCYPPDTPEFQCPTGVNCHSDPLPADCNQPQIWMAAVSLSDIELATGDPSWPAFWLPFQDVTAHNHSAQWTEVVVGPPPSDGGVTDGPTCGVQDAACSTANPCCDGYTCDATGICQWVIP